MTALLQPWPVARLAIVVLGFVSVVLALAAAPAQALRFWYLLYSPVAIAALSFGLSGALIASSVALACLLFFTVRLAPAFEGIIAGPASGFAPDPQGLEQVLREAMDRAGFLAVPGGAVGIESSQNLLNQAFLGVALITGVSCLVGWLADENRKRDRLYERQAFTDELTGLTNYRGLLTAIREEISRSTRFRRQFAYMMADVDVLKPLNDAHGHLVGDEVLRSVARILREQVRDMDTVARYGGDEFGVVLAETGLEGGIAVAERLRLAVQSNHIRTRGTDLAVTVSIGVACYPSDGETAIDLIEAADKALYRAKTAGRNSIAAAPTAPTPSAQPS